MRLIFYKLDKNIFDALRDGRKRVETRAATAKYKNLQAGETISFSCAGEVFEKRIAKAVHLSSIPALLKVYTAEDINPDLKTEEEITKMYYSFPGYKEKIEEFGIIAIELE